MAYAPAANNHINAIITDGNTVYVGGNFTTLGGVTGFKYLARYSAVTGAVDTTWKPQIPQPEPVQCMVLHKSSNSIFIGSGQANGFVQKWSTTSATRQSFVTFSGGTGITLDGLFLDGDNLFVGGNFTTVGGLTRNRIVKIDVTGNSGLGTVDASFVTNVANGQVETIVVDQNHVYFGGTFSTVNGSTRNRICKVKKTDGSVADDWIGSTGFTGTNVLSILLGSDSNVYACGEALTAYKSTSISASFVKLNKSGALQSFATPFASNVIFNKVIEVDGQLYVTRRPVSSAGGGIYKGTDGLNSFALDASFTGSISNGSINNRVMAQYNGLNLLIGINADTGAYNGSGTARHYAISKTTGAVVELQADVTAPTVTLSSAVVNGGSTSSSPVSMTATFSESVTGFVVGDVTVSGGSAGNFSGSGTTYTFDVTPSGQGLVSVSIASGVCQDAFGNTNSASSSYTFTYDSVQPTVTLSSATSNGALVNTTPVAMTATFSESVTGFTSGDISVTNGSVSGFSGSGTTYTFNVTPSGQGEVSVFITSGACQDSAGNQNQASSSYGFTYDSVQPTVSLSCNDISNGGTTTLLSIPFTATFSESVTGFVSGDVTVSGGSVSGFSGSGTSYTFNVIPSGLGAVSVSIGAGVATDGAGNSNTGSSSYSFTVISAAQPLISPTSPSVAKKQIVEITISKSELESLSGVSQASWKRMLVVYTSSGKKSVVCSYKPTPASPKSRFRANINTTATYTMAKVIVVKTDGSSVVTDRASISSPSQYDISVT